MIIYFHLSLLSIHVPLWESEHSSLTIVCRHLLLARSLSLYLPSQHQDRDACLNNGGAALWPDQLHSLVMTCHADGGRNEKHMFTDLSSVERSPQTVHSVCSCIERTCASQQVPPPPQLRALRLLLLCPCQTRTHGMHHACSKGPWMPK